MSVGDMNNSYFFDDKKRPSLPYSAGACFEIKRHKQLAPFDNGEFYKYPDMTSLTDPLLPSDILPTSEILIPFDNLMPWRHAPSPSEPHRVAPKTITERYLRHRPRKTEPYDEDMTSRRLEIVSCIRVRDGAYAQVVQCRVDGIQGLLTAKIFDPLYRWLDVKLDEPKSPVGLSESKWSREAAAYVRIQEGGLDGRYTPRFKGCWSFDVPWELELEPTTTIAADDTVTTSGPRSERDREGHVRWSSKSPTRHTFKITRNVRLLLMEHIPGHDISRWLLNGAYRNIPADVRMEVLARVAEAQSALWHIKVNHGDSHARNIIVGRREIHDDVDIGEDKKADDPSSSSLTPGKEEERPQKRRRLRETPEGGVQAWHVVLIDFSRSAVRDLPNTRNRLTQVPPLPQNPMTMCGGSWPVAGLRVAEYPNTNPDEKADWIPENLQSLSARREWMEARWGEGSTKAHLYQPIYYERLDEPTEDEQ